MATFWRPGKLSEESVQIHGKPGQPCSTGRLRVGFTGARESPHINCAARRSHRERPNGRGRSEANPRPRNGPESRERWVRVAWAYCVVRFSLLQPHTLPGSVSVHRANKDDAASAAKRPNGAILTERLLLVRGGDLRHFRGRFSVHELN